ncbi:MAG: hypothetical protein QOH68_4352, partial [Nocardioidaceae bacterium]|nr:hypothetical protein [Nocardioidaceae bacterium]
GRRCRRHSGLDSRVALDEHVSAADPMSPVRWGLVGSSEFCLDWVLPGLRAAAGAEPVAVVTRDADALRARGSDHGDLVVTESLAELATMGVDIIHVITPNDLHLPLALEAFALGLDVLMEKPMALSLDEARRMRQAAAESGRFLAVASCMAWSPVVERTREIVRSDGLGKVSHGHLTAGFDASNHHGWRQTTPTADGGGVLNDLGPHAIDALVRVLGPVVSVSAQLSTTVETYAADDTALLVLRHEGGSHSMVHLSFTHACNDLSLTGSTGQLTGTGWLGRRFAGQLALTRAERGASDFEAAAAGPAVETQALPFTDVLERQAVEVSAAVRGGVDPEHAAAADGIHVMAVLEAAQTSSLSQGSVTDA